MQNKTGNMELLPSGSCCLFTVVPACVHDIAQLGRYLEFLGFISNQNCPQSLVSKDRKIILSGEQWNTWESIPGKALADRAPCPGCSSSLLHLAHGAVGLDPPHYTAPWKKELLLVSPGCTCPAERGRAHVCSPQVPLPTHPCREGVAVALSGSSRMAMSTECLVFSSFILCPCLHFWIKQFNFVLLLPLLQSSLLWHSSLSILKVCINGDPLVAGFQFQGSAIPWVLSSWLLPRKMTFSILAVFVSLPVASQCG